MVTPHGDTDVSKLVNLCLIKIFSLILTPGPRKVPRYCDQNCRLSSVIDCYCYWLLRYSLKVMKLPGWDSFKIPSEHTITMYVLCQYKLCVYINVRCTNIFHKCLHCCKVRALFFCLCCLSHNIHVLQDNREKRKLLLIPLYHFHLLHVDLHISQAIAAKSLYLKIASERTQAKNLWFLNRNCLPLS